jgi:hypothetical protein
MNPTYPSSSVSATAPAAAVDPTTVKKVVDAIFSELEVLTANRPLLSFAVAALHQLVDAALLARVAARAAGK